MIGYSLFFLLELFLQQSITVLEVEILILLSINFPLPFALNTLHLFILDGELLV